jgi:hypothetical protein
VFRLAVATADDDGTISLRSVRAKTAPVLQVPEAPTVNWEESSPDTARSLLMQLRNSPNTTPLKAVPGPVPQIPTEAQLRAVSRTTARPVPAALNAMRVNNVLLTSGSDDTAGTIVVPDLLPRVEISPALIEASNLLPTPATDSQPVVGSPVKRVQETRRGVTKYFNWGSTVTIFNRNKGTTRTRGRLIEFYNPEDERPDVDDYNMPILLVAAQENTDSPVDEEEEDEGERLLKRKLTEIQPTLAYAWGDKDEEDLPKDFHKRMDNGEYMASTLPRTVLQWEPTNLWYYPLYFEDPGLERYGHTRHEWIQPFVSTGRFVSQVTTLPYQMALHPAKCPEYALGYYQPGEWAPKKRYQVPFNEEATATQFLWMTGLILLIP